MRQIISSIISKDHTPYNYCPPRSSEVTFIWQTQMILSYIPFHHKHNLIRSVRVHAHRLETTFSLKRAVNMRFICIHVQNLQHWSHVYYTLRILFQGMFPKLNLQKLYFITQFQRSQMCVSVTNSSTIKCWWKTILFHFMSHHTFQNGVSS
jgi:hypothetical protein